MRTKRRSGPVYTANQAISYNNEIGTKALRIQIELLKSQTPQNPAQADDFQKKIRKLENLLPENSYRQKTLVREERRKLIGPYIQYGKLTYTEVHKIAANKKIPLQYVAYNDSYLTNSNTCYYLQNFWLYTPGQCREIYSQVKRLAANEVGMVDCHPYAILPTLEQNPKTYPNTPQPKPLIEADLDSPTDNNINNNNNIEPNGNANQNDSDTDSDDDDSDDDSKSKNSDPNTLPNFFDYRKVPDTPMSYYSHSPTPPNMEPNDPPNPPNGHNNDNFQLPVYFLDLKMVASPSEVRALKRDEKGCIVKFEDNTVDLGATLANYNRLIDTYRYTEINRMRGLYDILNEEGEQLSHHLKYLKKYEDYLNTLIRLDTIFCAKDRAKENLKKFRRRINESYAFSFINAIKLFKNSRSTPKASYTQGPTSQRFCFALYEFALKALVALAHPELVDEANDAINDKKLRGEIVDIDQLVNYLDSQETTHRLKLSENRFLHDVEVISINQSGTEVSNNQLSLNDEDEDSDQSLLFNSKNRLRRHRHQSPSTRNSKPSSVVRFNPVQNEISNNDSDDDSSDHYPHGSSPISSPLGRMYYENSSPDLHRSPSLSPNHSSPGPSSPVGRKSRSPLTFPNTIVTNLDASKAPRRSGRINARKSPSINQENLDPDKTVVNINNYTMLSDNIGDLKRQMSQYLVNPPCMPSRAVTYIDKRPTQDYINELKETLTANEALYIMSILARSIMNIDNTQDKLSLLSHQAVALIIKEITSYSPPCQILLAFLSHDVCNDLYFLYDALYGATQTKNSYSGKSMIFEYVLIHSDIQVNFTQFHNSNNSYMNNKENEHRDNSYRKENTYRTNSYSYRNNTDRQYYDDPRGRSSQYRSDRSNRSDQDYRNRRDYSPNFNNRRNNDNQSRSPEKYSRSSRHDRIENYNVNVRHEIPDKQNHDSDRRRISSYDRNLNDDKIPSRYRDDSQGRRYPNQSRYYSLEKRNDYNRRNVTPSPDRQHYRHRQPSDHSLERNNNYNQSRDYRSNDRQNYDNNQNRDRFNSQDRYHDKRDSYKRSDSPFDSYRPSNRDRYSNNDRYRNQTSSRYRTSVSPNRERTPSSDRQPRPDRNYRNSQNYRRDISQDKKQKIRFLGETMNLDIKFPDAKQRKCKPTYNCTGRCDTFSNCLKCRSLDHVTCRCPYFEKLGDCFNCKPEYKHTLDECPKNSSKDNKNIVVFPAPSQ